MATAATAKTSRYDKLSDGYHYIDVRVYRHSDDPSLPAIYTDYKDTIYVDLHKPISAISSFAPLVAGVSQNRQLVVESVDGTANSIHTFLDLPAAITRRPNPQHGQSRPRGRRADRHEPLGLWL